MLLSLSTLNRLGLLLLRRAYDKAVIKCSGREAVTNFELSTYEGELSAEDNGGTIVLGVSTYLNSIMIVASLLLYLAC